MTARIDLDRNAGGRVRPEALAAAVEACERGLGNPSSAHAAGRAARAAVEAAREEVAALVGAVPSEVVFTSGGTEANNWALLGASAPGDMIFTTPIEHVSVLRAAERAQGLGRDCEFVEVDGAGRVEIPAAVDLVRRRAAERASTRILVSIGWVNGEIGTVQPLAEIGASLRTAIDAPGRLRLHSDAVQAPVALVLDVHEAGVEYLSLSAHKLGGLGGVGALVVRQGAPIEPGLVGGPQERDRRAGTENVPGIVAFGVAARLARAERARSAVELRELTEHLWSGLATNTTCVRLTPPDAAPGTLCVAFSGLRGDALVIALDLAGVAASTGSACAAGATEPSHVLRGLRVPESLARGTLRFSLGRGLDRAAVEEATRRIADVVARARRRSPLEESAPGSASPPAPPRDSSSPDLAASRGLAGPAHATG